MHLPGTPNRIRRRQKSAPALAAHGKVGLWTVTVSLAAAEPNGIAHLEKIMGTKFGDKRAMPLLVAECVGLSLVAGWFVGTRVLGISEAYFINNMQHYTDGYDIAWALSKGFVFGLVIGFLSCYEELNAREGGVGVGRVA